MDAHDDAPGMRRELGLADATSVVVGAIIGVGIFFTPTDVARLAGRADVALGVWALGGLVAALGAFTFAELGRRYPRAGGQYDVLRDAWGPFAGFVYVGCCLTAIQAGTCAIIAILCVQNLAVAAEVALGDGARLAAAALLVVGVAGANLVGVRHGAAIQNLTVVGKVLTLLAVGAVAAAFGEAGVDGPAGAPVPPASSWLAALLPAMFAYGGWQQALWVGGEVRDARRVLPRAILGGVALVVGVYLLAAWGFFALLGYEGVVGAEALAAEAVGRVFPGVGERVVGAAVAVSAFGVLNAQFLTGPRLTWALARDGRFFAPFAQVHAGTGTPVPAIVLLAALSLAVLAAGADRVGALTAWVVAVDALFFALTGLALVRLYRAEGQGPRLAWLVPVGFAALELGAVAGALADPSVRASAVVGLVWVGAVAALYPWLGRR